MQKEGQKSYILMSLGLAGLLVSVATGLHESFPFLQFLCTSACRETADISLLWAPIWFWGVIFYIPVIVFALLRKDLVPWIVAPAAGVEAALIWMLILMKAPCVYCIANAIVVVALLLVSLRKKTIWQEAALLLLFLLIFKTWLPFENSSIATANREPKSDIVAKIDGEEITDQRLEVSLGSKLFDAKKEIYRMKKEKLEQIIRDTILQKEAAKKDEPLDKYVEGLTPPDAQFPVTEEEIQKYLDDNQEHLKDWKGRIEDLRERVKAYLVQQKKLKDISSYAQTLEPQYGVEVFLQAPHPPNVRMNVEGAPSEGPAEAPVTVVEFSDYECPACRATHETVKQVKALYGDKVKWIFKDYPLKIHKEAFKAAEAAHCAGDQDKFWQYQETAFTGSRLYVGNLIDYAAQLGLDKEKFLKCMDEEKYKAYVSQCAQDAIRAGIDRTPSFIINGTVLSGGHTLETFKAAIDQELKKAEPNK